MRNLVIILFAALSAISVNAQSWEFLDFKDDFTDEVTYVAGVLGVGDEFPYENVGLGVQFFDGELFIKIVGAGMFLSENYKVKYKIRIDDNKTFEYGDFKLLKSSDDETIYFKSLKTKSQIKRGEENMNRLISEMRKGSKMIILIEDEYHSNKMLFSLDNANYAIGRLIDTNVAKID